MHKFCKHPSATNGNMTSKPINNINNYSSGDSNVLGNRNCNVATEDLISQNLNPINQSGSETYERNSILFPEMNSNRYNTEDNVFD